MLTGGALERRCACSEQRSVNMDDAQMNQQVGHIPSVAAEAGSIGRQKAGAASCRVWPPHNTNRGGSTMQRGRRIGSDPSVSQPQAQERGPQPAHRRERERQCVENTFRVQRLHERRGRQSEIDTPGLTSQGGIQNGAPSSRIACASLEPLTGTARSTHRRPNGGKHPR